MTAEQEILGIKGVCVSYGRAAVLQDVSLSIHAGEIFGLIGLNGAGKTSLIKTILGLRPPDTGSVQVFGKTPDNATARMRLAYLPERFDPPWFLTGMEFLKFSLSLYGRPFRGEEILQAAERIALDPAALKRRVQTYSKGMRQKLGILGTVLTGCELLVLDEPMSGLDPLARTLVKDMIINSKMDNKTACQTVFFSSHILADMDEMCGRVAVLHGGRLRFTGTPAELKKQGACENLERSFLHFIEKDKAA